MNSALLAVKTLMLLKQQQVNQVMAVPSPRLKTLSLNHGADTTGLSKIKTKADVKAFYIKMGYPNIDIITDQTMILHNSVQDFKKRYPEIAALSRADVQDLVYTAFKAKDLTSTRMTVFSNVRVSSCSYGFQQAMDTCGNTFEDYTSGALTASFVLGAETLGVADVAAIGWEVYAYYNYYSCLDSASGAYFDCIYVR